MLFLVAAQEHQIQRVPRARLVVLVSGSKHLVIPSIQEMILTALLVQLVIPLLHMK
jgi:hypothetical protein